MNKDEFAKSHLGLVHSLCSRFTGKGIEYDELYSAGCLGLAKAINNFDDSRGLQFSTYAFPVIMGELKRLFRDGGAVKVSRSLKELSLKINKLNNESELKNGRELSVSELAEKLGVTPEKIAEAVCSAQPTVSINSEDESSSAPEIPSPDIQYEITERLSLAAAIESLEENDKKIINLRYYRSKTQVETAKILNMTQVQISRREKKILSLIRQKMSG
ncbi:MAG: sigma-70 family RNA polymerase sigma factor [Oscillospiraceae bacterium]|nr:sigma-70 family RNA polymerase sigma factor [Oscillospiraceae bacterium]